MAAGFFRGDCLLRPLSWYKELKTPQGRRTEGFFLLEGAKAIRQVLSTHPRAVDELLVADTFTDTSSFAMHPCRMVAARKFDAIVNSTSPQGIAAVVRIPEGVYGDALPTEVGNRLVLLDGVQDPGNVGTIIRTAAAFDFSGVLLCGNSADPFAPKVVQASAGALFSVWIRRHEALGNAVKKLQRDGFILLCADVRGTRSLQFAACSRVIVALGSEGAGLSAEILSGADVRFAIPMNNKAVESLNVAVSAAVALYAVGEHCKLSGDC